MLTFIELGECPHHLLGAFIDALLQRRVQTLERLLGVLASGDIDQHIHRADQRP